MNNGPPYVLALVFGLLVSATLYMLLVWPRIEPDEEPDEEPAEEPEGPVKAVDPPKPGG